MMHVPHPASVLTAETIKQIRELSPAAEAEGKLTSSQLHIIYTYDWFRLFVPASLGGQEAPLPEALPILEAAAYADGSFGWTLNLGAGANIFAAYLFPDLSRIVFSTPRVCIAGSGAVGGNARKEGKDWRVEGKWKYASGSSHATAFTANCSLQQEGADPSAFSSFLFLPEEVTIHSTWNAYGLQATASHDIEVRQQLIPSERAFNLQAPSPYEQGPLYRFPFLQFAEITTALQVSGMALHFLDEMEEVIRQKQSASGEAMLQGSMPDTHAQAEAKLQAGRAWLYTLMWEAWAVCSAAKTLPPDLLRRISLSAKFLAQSAQESAAMLYPLAGMRILSADSQMNRTWRDLHTATQHILLSPLGMAAQSRIC